MAENYISNKLRNTNIRYCIGRIFSFTNKNQKRNYLVPDLKYKIKRSKKIGLRNLTIIEFYFHGGYFKNYFCFIKKNLMVF